MSKFFIILVIMMFYATNVNAQNIALSPSLTTKIQRQFHGRIIGVNPHKTCTNYTQNITIGGKKEQAQGLSCKDANGQWTRDHLYDVQLLQQNQSVVIITVNASSETILNVAE